MQSLHFQPLVVWSRLRALLQRKMSEGIERGGGEVRKAEIESVAQVIVGGVEIQSSTSIHKGIE